MIPLEPSAGTPPSHAPKSHRAGGEASADTVADGKTPTEENAGEFIDLMVSAESEAGPLGQVTAVSGKAWPEFDNDKAPSPKVNDAPHPPYYPAEEATSATLTPPALAQPAHTPPPATEIERPAAPDTPTEVNPVTLGAVTATRAASTSTPDVAQGTEPVTPPAQVAAISLHAPKAAFPAAGEPAPIDPKSPIGDALPPRQTDGEHRQSSNPQTAAPALQKLVSNAAAPSTFFMDPKVADHFEFTPVMAEASTARNLSPASASLAAPSTTTPPMSDPRSIVAQVATKVVKGQSGTLDIRLDPPELGRVSLTLSPSDDNITAVIASERADTHDFLRRHSEMLQRALREAGYSEVKLDFSASGDSPARGDDDGRQATSDSHWRNAAETAPPEASYSLKIAMNGLDIRL